MKALIGLVMAGIGIPVAIWAMNKAFAGQNGYNPIWLIALVLSAIGIVILIAQFKHWANS